MGVFLTIINLFWADVFQLSGSCRRMLATMKDNLSQRMARAEDRSFSQHWTNISLHWMIYRPADREVGLYTKAGKNGSNPSFFSDASGIPSTDMERLSRS
jgi:hypothetical protein